MNSTALPNSVAPTNSDLAKWISQIAQLTTPSEIYYVTDPAETWAVLSQQLVDSGTLISLNERKKPNSFLALSDPADVARIESRTFICSTHREDAGPTNNWMDPKQMKETLTELFRGSMQGRTMYIIPYCMGPLNSQHSKFGVEITDSPYVVLSMIIMTRVNKKIWGEINDGAFYTKCLHSLGAPLTPGQKDVSWPNSSTKYISHFPETKEIWSYGSGYGGNALLGKKCYALRIASVLAKDEGWLAEHMLIVKLISPENKAYYIAAAFPSACGKTNLAMIEPTIPGWRAETIGDDIAWIRFGEDGRLYALNPEAGFFGVAPGTGYDSNPNAMHTLEGGNAIYTNVARTDDGDIWWEGIGPTPEHLIDWQGNNWYRDQPHGTAAHPNSRYCVPIEQYPLIAPEWQNPEGVPLSAILFGGRRKTTVPLVYESFDWGHGVFSGSTMGSEQTAAAEGIVGKIRRDPMAMLPFIGYHVGDYLSHWLNIGTHADQKKLPKIFNVNWFRRDDDDAFLWPGFGENSRVLAWIISRIEGKVPGIKTPIGIIPNPDELNTIGLDISSECLAKALSINNDEWLAEVDDIHNWYEFIGERLPKELHKELESLTQRIHDSASKIN